MVLRRCLPGLKVLKFHDGNGKRRESLRAVIQHQVAQRLLLIIRSAITTKDNLTYKTVAAKLKRDPKTNARMVAQVCDLLDAAAWLAGVPLLALVKVRTESGRINPKAWINEPEIRKKLIDKSERYTFSDADFETIKEALEKLAGLGNHAAWALARQRMSSDQFFRSFTETVPWSDDAIEDLGTDTPTRTSISTISYSRDQRIRAEVMRRAGGRCELCGKLGFVRWDDTRYLESHHIIALANDGADRMTNVIALCPEHHREAHFGKDRDGLEQKMVLNVKALEGARKKKGQTVHLPDVVD